MRLFEYWAKRSRYYQRTATHPVKGIVVHSTACNQKRIAPFYNAWNKESATTCVHAVIGEGEHGFGCYQFIQFDKTVGGCGSGRNGTYNTSHVQFEICEDDRTDPAYFAKVYQEAVEFCAYLCELYDLEPDSIVCHSEAHALGYASNHADVMHWFPQHGKTMDDFREDVRDELMMTQEKFNEMANNWLASLGEQSTPAFAQEAVRFFMDQGTFKGDANGHPMANKPLTRGEYCTLRKREIDKGL